MPVRPRFDPTRSLIAARAFTFMGRAYSPGDPFPSPDEAGAIPDRLRARQYEARAVDFGPEAEVEPDLITMTGPAGGRYTISAPWLERPLSIRGKVNAEKALAEMREEGPPLGWIDGGTEVEIEDAGEGWFVISAPWLDEPEKIEGRDAAEARQREIHDAGAPSEPDEPEAPEIDENSTDEAGTAPDGGDAPDDNPAKPDTNDADERSAEPTPDADSDVAGDSGGDADGAGKSEDAPAGD